MINEYLPLTEYSSKYRVSISTLRRKIKTNDISFVFEDGKYQILDQPISNHQSTQYKTAIRPSLNNEEHFIMSETKDSGAIVKESAPMFGRNNHQHGEPPDSNSSLAGQVANQLLQEIKKAYSQILQEKESQILELKQELADLKTLVRVLEDENDKHNYKNSQ